MLWCFAVPCGAVSLARQLGAGASELGQRGFTRACNRQNGSDTTSGKYGTFHRRLGIENEKKTRSSTQSHVWESIAGAQPADGQSHVPISRLVTPLESGLQTSARAGGVHGSSTATAKGPCQGGLDSVDRKQFALRLELESRLEASLVHAAVFVLCFCFLSACIASYQPRSAIYEIHEHIRNSFYLREAEDVTLPDQAVEYIQTFLKATYEHANSVLDTTAGIDSNRCFGRNADRDWLSYQICKSKYWRMVASTMPRSLSENRFYPPDISTNDSTDPGC